MYFSKNIKRLAYDLFKMFLYIYIKNTSTREFPETFRGNLIFILHLYSNNFVYLFIAEKDMIEKSKILKKKNNKRSYPN